MYELIRSSQLDIMLMLCGACAVVMVLIVMTDFLARRRKQILIMLELVAFFLLWFDRLAYIYAGVEGDKAGIMVRVSNFMVFFLTPAIVLFFNMYLSDWLYKEGKVTVRLKRLRVISVLSVAAMVMAIISAITGLYYYIDDGNHYHRGGGFIIAYIIPIICPLVQYTVIRQYRKVFTRFIYMSLKLYIFVPIICGIVQIFAYGLSITNMSMVLVSVAMYFFTYVDVNKAAGQAHELELRKMAEEKRSMKRLFDQTAIAFVSAVEKKDDFAKGHSARVAGYARRIAEIVGKDEDYCDRVYYAALLHDVGLIGIPDSVIKNEANPDKWDYEAIRRKPKIGKEILSSITEYPYLSQGAYYSHERYNGTGYPDGLKGEEIPEIARIVAVADAYDTMTTKKRYRDARPYFVARESIVKGSGEEFDPLFANAMIKIIDDDNMDIDEKDMAAIESEFSCKEYREHVSRAVIIDNYPTVIEFECESNAESGEEYSMPSVLLFDSFDRRIHDNEKAIEAYKYAEYGEILFDGHYVATAARNIEVTERDIHAGRSGYKIIAARYDDHIRLEMNTEDKQFEAIVALADKTKAAYIALTGENCNIHNISVHKTEEKINENSIRRIANAISYIDRIESDIRNIQIDRDRSAATEGIEIKDILEIAFHSMSLPTASLVWHCPFAIVFAADDARIGGKNYREYALIKLNGEIGEIKGNAENKFIMEKTEDFVSWDSWKAANKRGIEYKISLEKHGNKILFEAENSGIRVEDTIIIKDNVNKVYVALTGDQCALTDIRIKYI